MTFGAGESADVRGADPRSRWPDRLTFTVQAGGESRLVRTRLVGTHWMRGVLGAIAAAAACNVPLESAVAALEDVQPFPGRMQPAPLPNGAVILRDEYNGSLETFQAALAVLRDARSKRRILVISDCSDFPKSGRQRSRYYAQVARECADMLIFIGERGAYGVGRALREGVPAGAVHAFYDLQEAARFLRRELREGDLVLLRGRTEHHLSRLYFEQLGSVRCRQHRCPVRFVCDRCPALGFEPDPSPAQAGPENAGQLQAAARRRNG